MHPLYKSCYIIYDIQAVVIITQYSSDFFLSHDNSCKSLHIIGVEGKEGRELLTFLKTNLSFQAELASFTKLREEKLLRMVLQVF